MKGLIKGIGAQIFFVATTLLNAQTSLTFENNVKYGYSLGQNGAFLCQNEVNPTEEEDTADYHHKLALLALDLGQFSYAFEHIEQAILLYRLSDLVNTESLKIVDSRILKARLFGFLGRYPDAVSELLNVFEENLAIRGENDCETIRLYNHIGWHLVRCVKKKVNLEDLSFLKLEILNNHLGEAEDENPQENLSDPYPSCILMLAQKCCERALSLDQKIHGEIHSDTAKSYSLIGWILGDRQMYIDALAIHQKALKIRLQCYSKMHPDIARSYSNLGWNYEKLNDLIKASRYYLQAFQMMEKVLPTGHPELEQYKENLRRVRNV